MNDLPLPVIVIDTREKTPLIFADLSAESGTLTSGDYSIRGMEGRFAVERKSIPDLISSLTSEHERFERECHRLRGYDFARLLIVGRKDEIPQYLARRKVNPRSLMGRLNAFEVRYRLPVVWMSTPEAAALTVERWVWYYYRETWRPFKALPSPEFIKRMEM